MRLEESWKVLKEQSAALGICFLSANSSLGWKVVGESVMTFRAVVPKLGVNYPLG